MAVPRPGDTLEPPEEVRKQVEPKVRHLMTELREGRLGAVLYELPESPSARRRPLTLSWWQSLWIPSEPGIQVIEDLEKMRGFSIRTWPDAEARLHYVYDAPGTMAVVYELSYVWLAGGIDTPDTLRLKFIFQRGAEGWTFYALYLSAKAIPYS
jgi:hypothetical protein